MSTDAAPSAEQSGCTHILALAVRSNGTLMHEEDLMPFEAAWCPACGAFRESSATSDPDPWTSPGK